MRQLRQSTVIEALACWGRHEASGRLRGQVELPDNDEVAAADLALRYRAPLISHILSHHPSGAVLVELEPADAGDLYLADGRRPQDWITQAAGDSLLHFRRLVEAESPPEGPLIGTLYASGPSPVVLYDGWHRGAAWFERCRGAKPSAISAYPLILTKH